MGIYYDYYDWSKVSAITQLDVDESSVEELIPEKNITSGKKTVGRTAANEIPQDLWEQIIDEDYKDDYSKENFVNSYFTVAVYEVRRNFGRSISANQSYKKTIKIINSSTIRKVTESKLQLQNTIDSGYKSKGFSLSETLRATYEIHELSEYCLENEKEVDEKFQYDAVAYDRVVALWDIVKIVILYRTNSNGETELVGVGDYLISQVQKTYTA